MSGVAPPSFLCQMKRFRSRCPQARHLPTFSKILFSFSSSVAAVNGFTM